MIKKGRPASRLIKILLISLGSIFILLILFAFTTLPFWAYYGLATGYSKTEKAPLNIVMLAGAGIPSENGLIRAYYTAKLARLCPDANVIIAVPGRITDSLGDPRRIATELELRGVNTTKIKFAVKGKNTRGQALEIAEIISQENLTLPLTIVSSPEHMKRAVLSFRKCGFTDINGLPAFESSLEDDLTFIDKDLKGNELAPPIGSNLQVRYQFWNHLKYEILVIREYFALTYYKLRGWI
jgi:uncharacterized SAM-binding protein YcdF (DUF218 family)